MVALEEFEPVIRRVYDYAAAAGLPLDTLIHESGTAQLEINLLHGDAVPLADQVLLFKRLTRQAAQQSGMHATFMAKPIAAQAGSSMHLHMSVVDEKTALRCLPALTMPTPKCSAISSAACRNTCPRSCRCLRRT